MKIIALGDSLTYGWMVNRGYIEFLKEYLMIKYPSNRLKIINRGIPGETAADGLRRLENDVLSQDPGLVFIQFALNDAYTGSTPDKYEENISKIVKNIIKNTNSEILLVSSVALNNSEENDYIEQFYGRLESVSGKENLPVARVHEYWKNKISGGIDFHDLVQFDQVHPTDTGYKLMAEAIMEHL